MGISANYALMLKYNQRQGNEKHIFKIIYLSKSEKYMTKERYSEVFKGVGNSP